MAVEHTPLSQGPTDDVVRRRRPALNLGPAVDENVFRYAKPRNCATNLSQLITTAASGAEWLGLHDEEIDVGVGGRVTSGV
jgi:hypothetical protein